MTDIVTNPALAKLHDYYSPSPPSWTPQTPAWYVLFALLALALLWYLTRSVHNWIRNAYRREALRELAGTAPNQFSALLKRTALAAWPREQIASLTGNAWIAFLGSTTTKHLFEAEPGNRVEEIALQQFLTSPQDEQALRAIVADWIRSHHVQA